MSSRAWWVLGAVAAIWWLLGVEDPAVAAAKAANAWQRQAVVGTWTDAAGEPGNYLRIELVESEPAAPMKVFGIVEMRALDGRMSLENVFGLGTQAATWNYESFYPLRLNVVRAGQGEFLAVRFDDRDHAWMRLTGDIATASRADVMEHGGARRMSRIVKEAAVGSNAER